MFDAVEEQNGTLDIPGVALAPPAQDIRRCEINQDQRWEEGLHHARIRDGVNIDEEITEGNFRKRFKFVADR